MCSPLLSYSVYNFANFNTTYMLAVLICNIPFSYSKDGKFLLFLSAKTAADSGAHWVAESLHKINWPSDGILTDSTDIVDLVRTLCLPIEASEG